MYLKICKIEKVVPILYFYSITLFILFFTVFFFFWIIFFYQFGFFDMLFLLFTWLNDWVNWGWVDMEMVCRP